MKKIQNIYDKSMVEDQPILDFFEAFNLFSKNKKSESYPFDIKYIHSNSEYLYNYNIPRYTECFFVKNTLFIISNHLQHQLDILADSARFLVSGIIKIKDLDNIYSYLKESNHEVLSYFRVKNADMTLKENQHYIAKYYMFLKKIEYSQNESSFFKMMLKSRRILSKVYNNGEIEKDIEYLLNKNF